jgi:hypothetical protein
MVAMPRLLYKKTHKSGHSGVGGESLGAGRLKAIPAVRKTTEHSVLPDEPGP